MGADAILMRRQVYGSGGTHLRPEIHSLYGRSAASTAPTVSLGQTVMLPMARWVDESFSTGAVEETGSSSSTKSAPPSLAVAAAALKAGIASIAVGASGVPQSSTMPVGASPSPAPGGVGASGVQHSWTMPASASLPAPSAHPAHRLGSPVSVPPSSAVPTSATSPRASASYLAPSSTKSVSL